MKILDGWLKDCNRIVSPNCDERPKNAEISLLVIHCISLPPGQYGGNEITDLFTNRLDPDEHPYFRDIYQLKVSAHILIRRDGDVVQYVSFDKRAWHAGQSSYCGVDRCNDYSIGIELEGIEHRGYTDRQYSKLAVITKTLIGHYPTLSIDRIAGHSDIAPGRKKDPGECFDWQRYLQLCGGIRSSFNDA